VVIIGIVAGACGPRVRVATDRCQMVPPEVINAIAPRMEQAGALRNGFAVQSTAGGRTWLISAELLKEGKPEESEGDIFTWASTAYDTPANDYRSVDPNARDRSGWPAADDLNVKVDGSIESRACVDDARPKQSETGLLGG